MGVYIPNMDKPKNCQMCFNLSCDHLVSFGFYEHGCPLIEIVPCKECKWCDNGIDEDGKPFLKCLGIHYGGTKAEDFCSYGERKEE